MMSSSVPNPAWGDRSSDRLGSDGAGRMIGVLVSVAAVSAQLKKLTELMSGRGSVRTQVASIEEAIEQEIA